jgi:hypothetical protein
MKKIHREKPKYEFKFGEKIVTIGNIPSRK